VKVALLGGTFDPPHVGHLLAASDAVDQLVLDRLVFVPASQQPLKADQIAAPAVHRLRMVELMAQGDRRFSVDEIEIHRTGLSFTVDTLEEYARRLPDADRYFLLGADAFATLDQWRDPARVLTLACVVVLTRMMDNGRNGSGDGPGSDAVARRVRALGGVQAAPPVTLATRRIDVSSTEIRERVRTGRPIRGFVTDPVREYIESNGLYR
jgi:nicotinate-nucleotide adenylyltransferase